MAVISIEIKGLKELEAKFARFPGIIKDAKQRAMDASVKHIHQKVTTYPPQQPSIRKLSAKQLAKLGTGGYRRMDTLKRKWTTKVSADGNTGTVGILLDYAPYVQGSIKEDPGQSRVMGKKGWKTVDTIAKEATPTVKNLFQGEIARLAKEMN